MLVPRSPEVQYCLDLLLNMGYVQVPKINKKDLQLKQFYYRRGQRTIDLCVRHGEKSFRVYGHAYNPEYYSKDHSCFEEFKEDFLEELTKHADTIEIAVGQYPIDNSPPKEIQYEDDNSNKVLTREEQIAVCQDLRDGMSRPEAVKKYGISYQQVNYYYCSKASRKILDSVPEPIQPTDTMSLKDQLSELDQKSAAIAAEKAELLKLASLADKVEALVKQGGYESLQAFVDAVEGNSSPVPAPKKSKSKAAKFIELTEEQKTKIIADLTAGKDRPYIVKTYGVPYQQANYYHLKVFPKKAK